ncbi:polyprenyl synthetase [Trichococcus palustris]|jgi:geranylgeranyl diphosphate synthase, type II|uniref:Farnesyl diphosphate synthase n=1 Tax=Trichococcus palustris TaxID=140314 RepID=A0A143YED0_9LACT|nr:farnesyl diphosphate synthase [Trichococcus palustris]CZQ87428.1 polyprenyl synthetase [Trichococcus palustris]SFK78936.1 geranylgeranyl diphosphate synthase, type II [Trichococcus palustris]
MNLNEFQTEWMGKFDDYLYSELGNCVPMQESLHEAMAYSLMGGGKRIRPLLVFATLALAGGDVKKGFAPAAALEFIHTYSLIHDDLPAIDNDDYRRGRLTSHKVYGEATAILAGDALLTAAFEMLAESQNLSDSQKIRLIALLAKAAGPNGMIAGQMDDIEGEEKKLTIEELMQVHEKKTGALIEFAVSAGCLVADADPHFSGKMQAFAKYLGLGYQIHNDLKDVVLDENETGKKIHHDAEMNKNTYPSILGTKEAMLALNDVIRNAEGCLDELAAEGAFPADERDKIIVLHQFLDYIRI